MHALLPDCHLLLTHITNRFTRTHITNWTCPWCTHTCLLTHSIEVGMQSSALAAVLAKVHFSDPVVVAPCVLSACTHATIGSLLASYWAATTKDE